jgi:hypothetical protein
MTDKERIAQLEAEVGDLKAEIRSLMDRHNDDWAIVEQDREEMVEAHHVARLREIGFIAERFFGGKLAYCVEDVRHWEEQSHHVSRVLHRDHVCYIARPDTVAPTAEEAEGDTNPERFPFR